jgi:hypothetical protein
MSAIRNRCAARSNRQASASWRCVLRLAAQARRLSPHVRMESEVSGLGACENEGCAGWAGAEPHAWETAHEPGYAACGTGYRQETYRRGGGGAAAGGRGALLGQARQRGLGARSGAEAAAAGRPPAGGVLRGRALRLQHLSPAERQARRELSGGGALDDAAPGWRAGKDEPARLPDAGQAAAGRGADGGLGARSSARGDARSGARPGRCGGGLAALPPAHRRLPVAPGGSIAPGWAGSSFWSPRIA